MPVLIDNIESAPVSTSVEESALASGSTEEAALPVTVNVEKSAPLASAPKSALLGAIPPAVGYQPNLAATDMSSMQVQISTTKEGFLTSVQVIYVPTEDLKDPYPAITVMSRPVVELGIYPAVDPLDATSSVMNLAVIGNKNYDIVRGVQDNIDILGVDELSEEDKNEEKSRILPRERSRWGLWRI